jgi:ABC-type lipoprotein export system ATPase subunit
VFSTHDQKVLNMADRRVDLEDGEIVRLGMRVADKWVFALERGSDALMADEDVPGPPSVPAG